MVFAFRYTPITTKRFHHSLPSTLISTFIHHRLSLESRFLHSHHQRHEIIQEICLKTFLNMETLETPAKVETFNEESGVLTSSDSTPKDLVNGDQPNSVKDDTMPLDQNGRNGNNSVEGRIVVHVEEDEALGEGVFHEVEVQGLSVSNAHENASEVVQVLVQVNPEKEENLLDEKVETDEADYNFSVGEFVWAKTSNRPWWPGQIYDPLYASEDILIYQKKDTLLVAFFGGETAAWCYPSVVKPFQKEFREMLTQGNSIGFRNAVEEALDRFSKCVELEMTCSCAPEEVQTKLARPLALSPGIRNGVMVPEGKFLGLSVKEFEPVDFLARLKCVAEVVCDVGELERTVLRSQLLAFNQANGWRQLHIYLELLDVLDSQGDVGDAAMDVFEFDDSADDPVVWPVLAKCSGIGSNSSAEKVYQQKQRSMNSRLAITSRKRKKDKEFEVRINANLAEDGSISDKSAFSPKEQKKATLSGPPSPHHNSNDLTHPKDGVQVTEGYKTGFLSRERKKSKYLSPPYTDLSPLYKSLISLKDSTPSSLNVSRISRGGESFGKSARLKCNGGAFRKKQCEEEKIDANVDASKILSELYSTALDPMSLESKRYDCVKGFLQNLRSHRFGSDPQICKTWEAEYVSSQNDIPTTDHQTNEGGAQRKEREDDAMKSVNIASGLSAEDMCTSNQRTSFNDTERKADSKGDAISHSLENKSLGMGLGLGLQGEDLHETGPQISAGDAKRKGRDWKEDARSQVSQKSAAVLLGLPAEDVSVTNFPAGEGSRLQSKGIDWSEDARLNNSQRKLFDNIVDLPGEYMHITDHPTSEGGARKRGRKRKNDAVSGMEDARLQDSEKKLVNSSDGLQTDHPASEGGARKRARKRKKDTVAGSIQIRSEMASFIANKNMSHDKEAEGETSAALLLNFGPGVPLPTKEDLITLFGRFGALNELETGVMKDSSSAQVVYQSRCNAEEAFSSSQKISPFGPAVVNYQLQYSTANSSKSKVIIKQCIPSPIAGSTLTPLSALPPNAETPPLQYVRQNLENMTSMLEKAGDNLQPVVKAHLESEIKRLLSKVETMT